MDKLKYYHLLSDDKTVREITHEKFRKLSHNKTYKLLALSDKEVFVWKHLNYMYLPLRQLEAILGEKVE